MKAREELSSVSSSGPVLATIGVFDGVHRGHRHLLRTLREEVISRGVRSAAVTLRQHPVTVLRPEVSVPYVCSLEDRLILLGREVDLVVPLTFDRDLSLLRPGQFVTLLRTALDLRGLVVGPDFAMGHNREGTVPVLQALGREMDFSLHAVEALDLEGLGMVSSTAVRRALEEGRVEEAVRLLGRPFALSGIVEAGEGRGRGLGFPTANLSIDPLLALPGDGVYASWVWVGDVRRPAAVSIGLRPTFGGGQRAVEAHILDFSEELYGAEVRLEFVARLRGQETFETADALVAQIHQDVDRTRRVLIGDQALSGAAGEKRANLP